jgi:hypothetical protein
MVHPHSLHHPRCGVGISERKIEVAHKRLGPCSSLSDPWRCGVVVHFAQDDKAYCVPFLMRQPRSPGCHPERKRGTSHTRVEHTKNCVIHSAVVVLHFVQDDTWSCARFGSAYLRALIRHPDETSGPLAGSLNYAG